MGAPVPLVVRRYAPLVRLDSREDYWPLDAGSYLAGCTLCWADGRGKVVELGMPDPARMGEHATDPYVHDGIDARQFTRPHDGSGTRLAGLPPDKGFFLRPNDLRAAHGSRENAASTPVYYQVSGHAISYWFCYGGSTLPRGIYPFAAPAVGPPAAAAEKAMPGQALEDLRTQYPELFGSVMEDAAAKSFPFDVVRKLEWAANALLDVAQDPPLMHDGDWERVRVLLAVDGETAETVELFQHHGSRPYPPPKDGRIQVASAWGTHATFPGPHHGLDLVDAGGPVWDPLERDDLLRDVRAEPWYGFGGAWGRVGKESEGTGPLGPSRWK